MARSALLAAMAAMAAMAVMAGIVGAGRCSIVSPTQLAMWKTDEVAAKTGAGGRSTLQRDGLAAVYGSLAPAVSRAVLQGAN